MKDTNTEQNTNTKLEGGTYEIIRNRLAAHGKDLRQKLGLLNESRKAVFGAIETQIISTERITTTNNCLSRDMIAIGNLFLFGYNVRMGLKTETNPHDVISIYHYDKTTHTFHNQEAGILDNEQFIRDFNNLYKYYRETKFSKFAIINNHLFMVFQIGKTSTEIKTFKWAIDHEKLTYIDNRSEHEFQLPDRYAFRWKRTTRDMHRNGKHPHVSIEDRLFVETIGGDLTIKVEDNTSTGRGIYAEHVDHKDQTLDDAEIQYAIIGNLIVLRIKPYMEESYRFIVYNDKLQEAVRIDALEDSCVLLPDDQGIIFAQGYYLQTGEFKLFDNDLSNMHFEKRITAQNGEDYLYIFYNDQTGAYALLPYNIINQSVDNLIICHGYALFESGELLFFKDDNEQKKHHAIQIWQTPYTGPNHQTEVHQDSFLYKLGNKDIVRAMAECQGILTLLNKDDSYQNLYIDLSKFTTDILDSYHWLSNEKTHELSEPLIAIKEAATSAIEEFEKVERIKRNTQQQVAQVSESANELITLIKRSRPADIDTFVQFLSDLRKTRGSVISLKELRYAPLDLIEQLDTTLNELNEKTAENTVNFLLKPESLDPYKIKIDSLEKSIQEITKVIDTETTEENIRKASGELEMLIEMVSNLKIKDATQTTRIIDEISAIYSSINQLNASLKKKRKELLSVEGKAEFNAQLKLINQGVVNYLDIADKPEKCDESLTKLMVQLEELEGKFAEFDEFIDQLSQKREEIYNVFESKKLQLLEARNNKTNALEKSARRIIGGISNRLKSFKSVQEINGYLASDLMAEKVRNIIEQLIELEDSVKADAIQSAIKSAKEEAIRQLKDKQELFANGDNIISFGNHQFLVNKQPLDLTMVQREDGFYYHLTGTNFFEKVSSEQLKGTADVWNQTLISENEKVYRSEYLAWLIYTSSNEEQLHELQKKTLEELTESVKQFMATRYAEGYIKGVHDHDAALVLEQIIHLHQTTGLLRYSSQVRATSRALWTLFLDSTKKTDLQDQINGNKAILQLFKQTSVASELVTTIAEEFTAINEKIELFPSHLLHPAATYLVEQLSTVPYFIIDDEAAQIIEKFNFYLKNKNAEKAFQQSLEKLANNPIAAFQLTNNWITAFIDSADLAHLQEFKEEAAICILTNTFDKQHVQHQSLTATVKEIKGDHTSIDNSTLVFDFPKWIEKMSLFTAETAPKFEAFIQLKKELSENFKEELRLSEFMPKVMSSFVRNQLIDEVYLPLIGANLAKQIGTAGANKRTDLMGMLLLISPPGYGKTTLMEYIANRLGLIFMKVNGPAIGHEVTSIDPQSAPHASACEELEKLNLALEMGDNVMLYLDDIQHCNPELLQKFISLCDAQRKIEGVYKGKSKTYDLKGRKVAVVMAGNPYTESGDKFQIPDMLANRADVYNLGDIIGDSDTAFKLSYIQNSLTSNRILANLAQKSMKDVLTFIQWAENDSHESLEFEASYSSEESNEYVSILKKVLAIRDVVLSVNLEYIRSAAQADAYRTEPPFKMQGSYRNMNKMVEQVVPIMNEEELKSLILTHYQNEAQTLTTGAEANVLKFKAMTGWMAMNEQQRWANILETFNKQQKLKGLGGNEMAHLLQQLEQLNATIQSIGNKMTST